MVSSAVYRYFPSRDDLLTALIVDAYDALGDAAEAAGAEHPRRRRSTRWLAVHRAVRTLGARPPARVRADLRHPGPRLPRAAGHDPRRGPRPPRTHTASYARGPEDENGRGVAGRPRSHASLAGDLARAAAAGRHPYSDDRALAQRGDGVDHVDRRDQLRVVRHLNNVIEDFDAWFDYEMTCCADDLGLVG